MLNGKDAAGNESSQSTLTVTNIERTAPTVVYGTNGGSGASASTTVTVSDLGGSLINTSTLQYVWDTQNTVTPTSGWTAFTNGATITKAVSGTYYLWIKASDNAGNTLVSKTNAFTVVIVAVSNFNYTAGVQTFTVPYTGTYKLEVWGAQGGLGTNHSGTGASYAPGWGGYSSGNIVLTAGQSIYIYVGGQGITGAGAAGGYNGGGATGNSSYPAGSGGGATDIRLGGNALGNRVIVAGGGGGGGNCSIGGYGGGLSGQQPNSSTQYGSRTAGIAGTQTSGYSLGQGQGNNGQNLAGGGGGGYYGGGQGDNSTGGGGGSGYIGGVTGGTMSNGVRSGHGYATITYVGS